MKTKNIFRMLLVAAALLMGANNVKATEIPIGENYPRNGEIRIEREWFTNVEENWTLRIYLTITDEYNWLLEVLPNGHFLSKEGEFKNWEGAYYNVDQANQSRWNGCNDFSEGYIQLTIGKDGASHLVDGGLILKATGMNITNITLEAPDDGSTHTTNPTVDVTLSFNPNLQTVKVGETVDGPTITATANNGATNVTGLTYTYTSNNTTIATVNNEGAVTGVAEGSTTITVSWGAITGYNAGSATYTVNVTKAQQQQPTTYTVTVSAGSNGSAYADKQNAASGEKVTIYTNPNSGYRVSSVTVTGGVSVSEETANTTYSFTMPANNVTVNVTFELETQGTPDQVVIGSTGYATYSNAENAINLSGLSGVKAYIATAISLEQNKVTLTQVSGVVAANTGLIFISENKQPGTFNLPIASSTGTTYDNNLLIPSYANTTLSPSDAWYTYYVLVQRENNSVKFAEIYSYDAQPGAGKAYLRTSKNQASARTRGLSIEISDGTTGINAVENEQGESVIYNLRGQRVENPTKGLYIINGKKVIIK